MTNTTYHLGHWDGQRKDAESLDIEVTAFEQRLTMTVKNDHGNGRNTYPREVILEVRDNGDLAVLCYDKEEGSDEPLIVLLKASGGHDIIEP